MNLAVVILAGGQGTRFWPISRTKYPKQFLNLSNSEYSMIQVTAARMRKLVDVVPHIVTSSGYVDLVKKHLPESHIICEPYGKNTAPAIGLAALHIRKKDPEAIMIVLPSDHTVENDDILIAALKDAAILAHSKELLMTIGVEPSSPNTGYGYIKIAEKISGSSYYVKRFYEKPSSERAIKYLEEGGYYWNSGMFVWKASVILKAIEKYMPVLHAGLLRIDAVLGTPEEKEITEEVFAGLESQSIDFGVLEHSQECAVIAAPGFGWSDVGSWDAWAAMFPKDKDNNFISGNGILLESKNCIIRSENKFAAVLGCEDLVLIDTGDVILACHKDKLQEIKKLLGWLDEQNMTDLI